MSAADEPTYGLYLAVKAAIRTVNPISVYDIRPLTDAVMPVIIAALEERRTQVLAEAADEIAGVDFHPNARANCLDIAVGLARRIRALAAEPADPMKAAAPVLGVTEYGTAFRATEQAPVEVHSPTSSRDEAAARADRYRDMYPTAHLVQRTVHHGEWTEVTS
ncbi:hypothetical protein AB0M89_13455 [Streptomyces microflavus]|uniref:hypothetical protein n=1 Tax=Streptomyces microflavus TaxID=1919 RepID=UPI00343BC62B